MWVSGPPLGALLTENVSNKKGRRLWLASCYMVSGDKQTRAVQVEGHRVDEQWMGRGSCQ